MANPPAHAIPAAPWSRLRWKPLAATAWQDLAHYYAQRDLPWQAGYAARQAERLDPSLALMLNADLAPLNQSAWRDAATGDGQLGHATLPNVGKLAEHFRQALADTPDDWLTALYLARLHDIANQPGEHAHILKQALACEPIPGETRHWLGVWRLSAGDAQGAVTALAPLIYLPRQRHGSMMYLGEALLRTGKLAAAEKAFTRAARSPNPDFLLTLAQRVYCHNYWQEAIALLHHAISLRPGHVPTWLTLARLQSEVYELAGCRTSLDRLKALDPGNTETALIEAGLQGRIGDARSHYQQLLDTYQHGGDPLSRLASSVAMTALYHDQLTPEDIASLHRRLCTPIETSVGVPTLFPLDPASTDARNNRTLRIGYVTGDLHRQHPVNLFLLPVLKHHDHARVHIAIYHTGTMFDDYTRQAQACADTWREAAKLDDDALHQTILADHIDILVDLAGHTSSHRLGVFAKRAAPVQATFLGYPHSTGLTTIDWLIGDATVSPAGHSHLFSEGIAQLPHSVFCWAPVDDYPLPAARPASAVPVFGSFNNAMKLSPRTLALWAQVLQAVPDAQLLLKAPSFRDATVKARFTALLAEQGIAPERLILRGPSGLAEMMQEYGDIDIALDPTPYNGGTTTLQALWMGVPTVTLAGGNFVGRMGASFLATLGESGWIASDTADYVAKAVALARQLAAVRSGRTALRERLQASSLCDIAAYTRDIEALYHRMWHQHRCDDTRHTPRLLAAQARPMHNAADAVPYHTPYPSD